MEGSEEEDGVSRLHPLGVQPSIVRPNEVAAPKPALKPALKPAPNPAPKPQPPVPSAPTPVQPAKESVKQPAKEVDQTAVVPKREVVSINEGIGASLASFLKAIDLDELSVRVEKEGADAIKDVRRRLAQHVGIEPRDTRIDRFLRLSLRLMPQGDDDDEMRAHLLGLLGENTTKIKRWMRTRLEHRHSGSSENFLDDAVRLGEALDRIPGPGFSIPLSADTKVLPNIADLPQLQNEVARIVAQMNPASAGGISA